MEYFFFFLLRVEYFFFFLSELHVHFAGCHILLLVQYCWCYHGRFKRGGGGGGEDEKVQSQIKKIMV